MRVLKFLLLVLLVAVGAAYGFTTASTLLSDTDVPPRIQCASELLEVSVSDGEEALLAGVTASDKQDGDITGKLRIRGVSKLVTNDTAKVSYIVFDSDGNAATASRMIRYTDYEKPHFALSRGLVYTEGEAIKLLDRLTAEDVLDGDITNSIRVSSRSSTSDPDIKTVAVQVTNSMGDTARINLPIVIYSGTEVRPSILLTQYLIYLPQGGSFNADRYLAVVSTANGQGNIKDVQITDTVDTSTPGTYYVYYRYPYNYTVGMSVLTVVVE